VAVLSVVIYHAVPQAVPGGFIGVDVFFVISGYLITKLIASDIGRQRFSVAAFYVRRTKRIFPALFVMLFTVLALGFYLLTPTELKSLGRTMAATAGFVSNIIFWQDTGYFDSAAESKPLLHTWSLAVEEQFYVLWPLTVLLIHGRRHARAILFWLLAISFAASCYLTIRHQATAFYLLPTRAWELLIGAALALGMVPPLKGHAQRDAAAMLGLALIGAALMLLDSTSAFPGWNALAPCIGTALIIAAGDGGGNVVAQRLLSKRPVVFVGLISYSLYLWHWPLLSLARIVERGHLSHFVSLSVVAAAVVLSALTWRYVETPLRARSITPAATPVLARYATVSLVALAVGLYVYLENGFVSRASPQLVRAEKARFDVNPRSSTCLRWQAALGPLPMTECMSDQSVFSRRLVLWGDSHADAAAPGLVAFARAHGYSTHQLTMAGCPPLLEAEVVATGADYSPCVAFNRQVIEYIAREPTVEVVVLSARWTLYTENARFGDDPGSVSYLTDSTDRAWSSDASKRVFARALDATVYRLREAGRTVLLLGTIPPLGVNVPACLARNHMPLSGVSRCDAAAAAVLPHLAFADQQIEMVVRTNRSVCAYFPKQLFCASDRCVATRGSEILYANDDHLSVQGALFLSQNLDFAPCIDRIFSPSSGRTSSTVSDIR
jgi:peptidoglycan/LPS O-acetylase OafA/YrhL